MMPIQERRKNNSGSLKHVYLFRLPAKVVLVKINEKHFYCFKNYFIMFHLYCVRLCYCRVCCANRSHFIVHGKLSQSFYTSILKGFLFCIIYYCHTYFVFQKSTFQTMANIFYSKWIICFLVTIGYITYVA